MERPIYPSLIPQEKLDVREHEHWAGLWNEKLCTSIEEKLSQVQREWSATPAASRKPQMPEAQDLYKYRAFDDKHPERTRAILADHKLWSSGLRSLNDPMEAGFIPPSDNLEATSAFSFVYLMRSQWSGCISFSRDPISTLMWAHYAGDHTGFCIKYRRDDSYLLSTDACQPVLYRRSAPKLSLDDDAPLQQLVNLVFWTKAEAWEHEQEWRLRYPRTEAYTRAGLLKPHGVIFGLKTPPEVKQFLRTCAPELSYGDVKSTDDGYRLEIAWQTDETKHATALRPKWPSVAASEGFQSTLQLAIEIAELQLAKHGEFNPFGIVAYRGEVKVLTAPDPKSSDSHMSASQYARSVEDMIREMRGHEQLLFAAIVKDVTLRPVEGGPVESAIEGRLEESGGLSAQFIQYYRLEDGVQFGERVVIPKSHHLIPE